MRGQCNNPNVKQIIIEDQVGEKPYWELEPKSMKPKEQDLIPLTVKIYTEE